jgi:hypothetical protein
MNLIRKAGEGLTSAADQHLVHQYFTAHPDKWKEVLDAAHAWNKTTKLPVSDSQNPFLVDTGKKL